jgi:23S rRNA (cytidine2498-2'-O)-methyltransferase
VFAHLILHDPREIRGDSVNALAARLLEGFLEAVRGVRVEAAWPCVFLSPAEVVGLGRRVAAVEEAFHEGLRRRLSRVQRLAQADLPRGVGPAAGWAVWFADFGRAFASRAVFVNGPRRMADDERAPSRSYLKVEEAYAIFGREPAAGETVADLGAAPGGWSFSAAKRGARVVAVDNGPLKGGAADNPLIDHRREDAFSFRPAPGERFDWLLCDLVEDPNHVLENVVRPWLENRWCARFVINLKFGRVDPLAFLRQMRTPGGVLARHAPGARVRHLYHDREEFTVVGEVTA